MNPYLGMAAALGSGIWGLEQRLDRPAITKGNAYASDVPKLPDSLTSAVELFSRSTAARELFGDTFVDHYLVSRRHEIREANRAVTDWDLRRYFETV